MSEKKGMQTATRVATNGQYGAGSGGMLVIPKTEVTKVRGLFCMSMRFCKFECTCKLT